MIADDAMEIDQEGQRQKLKTNEAKALQHEAQGTVQRRVFEHPIRLQIRPAGAGQRGSALCGAHVLCLC